MRITGVRLQNIACFEDLSLDFTNPDSGVVAPWVVILGANGCGKSTLLQMIAAALTGEANLQTTAGDVNWFGYARDYKHQEISQTLLWLQSGPGDKNHDSTEPAAPFSSPVQAYFRIIESGAPPKLEFGLSIVEHLYHHRLNVGWFACGYGASRRLSGQVSNDRNSLPVFPVSAKPYRFSSTFGNPFGMTDVPDWIAGLYFSSIHSDHTEADLTRYAKAEAAILSVLPHVASIKVMIDRQVIVTEGDTRVPLERLSDGYRGTLAWIGDLIRRLFDAYPDSEDPLKESGVVLVDEIDLHLHPKWQRSVVEDVRKLFPKLQFIVTSHSPFVAQDMRPEDKIIVLERSGKDGKGPVVAREENGSLESWSADQILSDYFGLEDGTRGTKTQKAEQRFVRLLGAEAAGKLTARQAKELEQLRGKVDAIPLGETPDERAFYRIADSVVAMLQRDTEELQTSSNAVHEESQTYQFVDDVSSGD